MTDPGAATTRQVLLLAAAVDGRLVDRYTARGWTTRQLAASTGRATSVPRRRLRRLVASGLLAAGSGHGYAERLWRLTHAGHAVLHAHRAGDLRRWWVTGTDRAGELSFTPAPTAAAAVARHRRADPPAAAAVRLVDGPLTTAEMLDRAWQHDLGWAAAWAVARLRPGTVPTAPLTRPDAAALLPAAVLDQLTAQVTDRRHTLHGHTTDGFAPPDVAPSSRHSWHAWLGTAATEIAAPAAAAPMPPGLTPVLDATPPRGIATPTTVAGRAFPPPRPTHAGPAALAAANPFPPPPARPSHTRHGPHH